MASSTQQESKAPVRQGSPIPTAWEQYAIYAGDPKHPYNLKKDTIKKIFKNCDKMDVEGRITFYHSLLSIKVKIGLEHNNYKKLKEDYPGHEEQLSQFDGFLKTQLDLLCKEGGTDLNTFYTELNLLLYGEKFADAFANISFNRTGKQGGRKTRKKCRRFRNNLKKNKMSRNYIMLKQCGGGKAKMGSKSKPYSSKRKAMRSRRRVCYYKKKGRTLKLKKKAKKSKKRSRRRR